MRRFFSLSCYNVSSFLLLLLWCSFSQYFFLPLKNTFMVMIFIRCFSIETKQKLMGISIVYKRVALIDPGKVCHRNYFGLI